MGLILAPFLVPFLGPKTGPNSGPLFDSFRGSVLAQKCGPNRLQAPKKASRRHRSTPRRAPSGCASAVLVLFEKATKTLYFTMVLVPPSCPKRHEDSHKALMGPSCTPRSGQEGSTKATRTTSSETGPKKTPKRHQTGCQKRARKGSESRSEKGSENGVRQLAEISGAGSGS